MNEPTLELPTVTLVAVTSVAIEETARAVRRCLDQVDFGGVSWISDQAPPTSIAGSVAWHQIEPITSRTSYSRFVLEELAAKIATEHALLVQWDGFVVAPSAWDDSFLAYDYIGAPWPHFVDGLNVGNGGFSLRSRRLLQATSRLPRTHEPEDVAICRTWRPQLEQQEGIVFAPESVASRFAYERGAWAFSSFGFHGSFNLDRFISSRQAREILTKIEPQLIADNELTELFRAALLSGDILQALRMLKRKFERWRPSSRR